MTTKHSPFSKNTGFLGSLLFLGIAAALSVGVPLGSALQSVKNMNEQSKEAIDIASNPEATREELQKLTPQVQRNLQNQTNDRLALLTLGASLATASTPGGGAQVETNTQRVIEALVNHVPTLTSEVVNYQSDPNSSWNRNNGSDRPSEGTVPTAGLLPGEVSGGTGDVRISLIWDANSDLDLHVIDPCGFETSFLNKERFCLGLKSELDVDNIPGGPGSVENIFWKAGEAPTGTYMYWVQCFFGCEPTPATFTLIRTVDGRRTSTTGTLSANKEESEIITFTRSQ